MTLKNGSSCPPVLTTSRRHGFPNAPAPRVHRYQCPLPLPCFQSLPTTKFRNSCTLTKMQNAPGAWGVFPIFHFHFSSFQSAGARGASLTVRLSAVSCRLSARISSLECALASKHRVLPGFGRNWPPLTPLECALTKTGPVSPLECALPKKGGGEGVSLFSAFYFFQFQFICAGWLRMPEYSDAKAN